MANPSFSGNVMRVEIFDQLYDTVEHIGVNGVIAIVSEILDISSFQRRIIRVIRKFGSDKTH